MKDLVFIHGGPGLKDYLADYFTGQFGKSVQTHFYTQVAEPVEPMANAVSELSLQIDKCAGSFYLVCHSWGGVIALEYLRSHNMRKPKGLILINSALSAQQLDLKHKLSWEQLFLSPDELENGHILIERLRNEFDEKVFQSFAAYAQTFDLRPFLQTLKMPILNIYGIKDLRVSADSMRAYADHNQSVRNVEVRGAGHFPFVSVENRKLIIDRIQVFLEDQS